MGDPTKRTTKAGDKVEGSYGLLSGFFGADADGIFDGADEDFAVTDFAGFGGFNDGVDGFGSAVVGDDDFDFDFGEEIDGIFAAAIDFGVAFLAAEAFDFGDRHAFNAEAGEGVFDVFEFEGLNDGLNFFHAKKFLSRERRY
jgi:hypothetical protein